VVKVAIVVAVLALPSWFAISLGAAHGVALALVALAAAVLLVVRAVRREGSHPRLHAGEMTMRSSEARIETANASRYLVQFCKHAAKIGDHLKHGHMRGEHARPEVRGVEFTDRHGTLDLSWGRCVLDADSDGLTVRVDADTEDHLREVQNIIAADLHRFGHRDNVTVTWQPPRVQADEEG
jgi:hypothetical protein